MEDSVVESPRCLPLAGCCLVLCSCLLEAPTEECRGLDIEKSALSEILSAISSVALLLTFLPVFPDGDE